MIIQGRRQGCGGVPGRCPQCVALYHLTAGPNVPTCPLCRGRHWADQDCKGFDMIRGIDND